MNLYGISFREKGDTRRNTALIMADDEIKAIHKFKSNIEGDDGYDVDKRTLRWAGQSLPLIVNDGYLLIEGDVND